MCSFCVPASPYIFIFLNILVIVLESLNMHMHCVCMTVCQGKVLQRKGIYIYIQECLLRHGDCYHPPSGKKRRKKTLQTFPHPFSFSSLFSILHLLSSAFSLSLSVSLTKAAVSSKMRPRTEGMQMKSLLVD